MSFRRRWREAEPSTWQEWMPRSEIASISGGGQLVCMTQLPGGMAVLTTGP